MTNLATEKASETPPKLALFLPSLEGGGAERIMVNLAEGFAKRGVMTDMVLARAEGPYLSQVAPEVNVVDLKAFRVLFSTGALAEYLRTSRPDAVISALDYANLVAVWAKRLARTDTKVLVTVHNQLTVPMTGRRGLKSSAVLKLMRPFYPWADEIIAVSDGVADDVTSTTGIPRRLISTIYNPVVSDAMLAKGKGAVNSNWVKEDDPPIILGIGRFTEQKDFPTLIRAFDLVRRTHKAKLIILGEGPLRGELEALVVELGLRDSVVLPGFVDNPYAYLKRAAVFALSSKWEGLPTVLIEALALGTPIVATNCKSGPDEILQGGKYGTLVPISDIQALADGLRGTLETLGQRSQVTPEAYEPFTMDAAVDAYLSAAGLNL